MSETYKKELKVYKTIWEQTRAVLKGGVFVRQLAIDSNEVFPFSEELKADDPNNWKKRKQDLINGGTFLPVASNTLAGYSGQAFSRPYQINLPTKMKSLEKDIDGAGTKLEQQLKQAFIYAMGFNFCGILIDFFRQNEQGEVTMGDLEKRKAGAAIRLFDPDDILDWAYINENGRQVLSYLKLRFYDEYVLDLKNFNKGVETNKKVRILDIRLLDGKVYYVSKTESQDRGGWVTSEIAEFKDSKGQNLGFIPFSFIGADTNEGALEVAEFHKLVDLNLAHFRSACDFDETSSVAGQATLLLSGVTEEWNKEVLGGKIAFGIRRYLPLNEGASGQMLQVAPNILSFESMKHKENQMLSIGARLAERTSNNLQKTATEVKSSNNHSGSVLSNCVSNIESAYLWAFGVAGLYLGEVFKDEDFQMNKNFNIEKLTLEERRQLMAEWQGKLISIEEARETLKDTGNLIHTLDEFLTEFSSGKTKSFLNTTKEENQNGVKN